MSDQAPSRPGFWAVARSPRMIGFLLLFLLAAGVCGRLGVWQLDRAYERAELAEQHEVAEAEAAGPEGLGVLLPPQSTFPGELVGRQAWVEGEYEPEGQLLVAGRALDGRTGYLVLTPLRVSDDGTRGASWADLSGPPVVPVVRGWVPAADAADAAALEVPTGEVRLTAYLQASEAAGTGGLPEGQTDSISSAALANAWGNPIYGGYLVLMESDPAQVSAADGGPHLLPRPTIEGGNGVNVQNAFYALQWWIFGLFAVALWVRLVRDEAAGGRKRSDGVGGGIAGLPDLPSSPRGEGLGTGGTGQADGTEGSGGAASSGDPVSRPSV
ncbi:SURF1 family protein [Oerskovia jenensis]|uniref:SURF1 family protein n=1 Tax=Oerskovia jenensis TaxID=162169 RepID=UPI0036D99258